MSDLLKQSIADAKAVRETALANAKSFLEEQFAAEMKNMFASKLAEEMNETEIAEELGTSAIGGDDSNVASSQKPVGPSALASKTSTDTSGKGIDIVNEEEETVNDEETVNEEEEVDVDVDGDDDEDVDISSDELDEILAELSGEIAEEQVSEEQVAEEQVSEGELDEEIDLDEILAELEREEAGAAAPQVPQVPQAPQDPADPSEPEVPQAPAEPVANDEEVPAVPNPMEESEVTQDEMAEALIAINEENDRLKTDLSEHVKTIKYLKSVLSETNLLNAKLLFTNKLFKGKSLSENQKMKVINTFDLTKNIREVKLAYTVLAESFNSGASVVNKKTNTTAQSITEGLASKPVKSTKPELIVETKVSDMQSRFQKLAGITK